MSLSREFLETTEAWYLFHRTLCRILRCIYNGQHQALASPPPPPPPSSFFYFFFLSHTETALWGGTAASRPQADKTLWLSGDVEKNFSQRYTSNPVYTPSEAAHIRPGANHAIADHVGASPGGRDWRLCFCGGGVVLGSQAGLYYGGTFLIRSTAGKVPALKVQFPPSV